MQSPESTEAQRGAEVKHGFKRRLQGLASEARSRLDGTVGLDAQSHLGRALVVILLPIGVVSCFAIPALVLFAPMMVIGALLIFLRMLLGAEQPSARTLFKYAYDSTTNKLIASPLYLRVAEEPYWLALGDAARGLGLPEALTPRRPRSLSELISNAAASPELLLRFDEYRRGEDLRAQLRSAWASLLLSPAGSGAAWLGLLSLALPIGGVLGFGGLALWESQQRLAAERLGRICAFCDYFSADVEDWVQLIEELKETGRVSLEQELEPQAATTPVSPTQRQS